ncbi:hypothetical protein SAMN05428971_4210 [Candidatus Pantoea varia]|uniref:Uncharacterized protein n=1 Tax=Candidatus Pantoea varia TaxID=1881036 RepID=A0A1I5HP30_9GAMM|nr:hypothetical protein [Pantoea varia]SFO49750.1 hypothetical protein SAMN05428971_4210 [Pantoea varia]
MLVGFGALRERYAIELAQPLRVKSAIGTVRSHHESQGRVENHYPPGYQPEDNFAGHFAFGLKYEEVHLEFFARLFAAVGPELLESWCRREPFGQYARRPGFLYEWLTGETLQVPDVTNGGYIEAISSKAYLTRTTVKRNRRWRINDNLPVSATITSSMDFRVSYDRTLDVFSKRLMRRYAGCYRFGELKTYEGGTLSNFSFSEYEDARFAWRYPDLTQHVLYTCRVIEHTVRIEMANEARVLVIFQRAQQRLKEVVEMPDQDASRIIRSLKENGCLISGKLKKTFPLLDDIDTSQRIVDAVRSAFEPQEQKP